MAKDSTAAKQQVLARMQVPERPHQYVLGCFESRITVYTQQVRALNLIYALDDELKQSATTVAVVGAGAGGLMAAAAAGICGYRVSVFDLNPNPLDLIGPSQKRWLHPHIYEWPKPESEQAAAGLPFLDWQQDLAFKVVAGLRDDWSKLVKTYNIEVHCKIKNLGIDPVADGKYLLHWNGEGPNWPATAALAPPAAQAPWGHRAGDRMRIQRFDVVILAVGFGKETPSNQFSQDIVRSYWRDDNIDRDDDYTTSPISKVLISGTGDGGLIDLLRYSFKGFRHEEIIKEFQAKWLVQPGFDAVKAKILQIEEQAWKMLKAGENYRPYLNLSYRDLADSLVLKDVPLRKNIQPFLTGMQTLPLDLQSAPINRFLFSLTNAQYIPGPLRSASKEKERWAVTFESGQEETFDAVVIRHGPAPAMAQYFPEIWALCQDLRQRARETPDPTRAPLDYAQFYADRLTLAADLLKPELPAQSVEELEKAIPVVPSPTAEQPAAVARYLEGLIDGTLQQPED